MTPEASPEASPGASPDASRGLTTLTAASLALVLLAGLLTASYRLGTRAAMLGLPDEFAVLSEIYAHVSLDAVAVPDDGALAAGAARGMLGALGDPYAAYYDAEGFSRLSELLDGTFTGVGLLLEERPGGVLEVVKVIPGGPAAGAGVEVGERIVSVDGERMVGRPSEEVVARVRGPEGTTVRVGLEGGSKGPRELKLRRARLELPVLETELLDGGVGVVRLLEFSQGVGERVRREIGRLMDQGARGIVLDLRGNPGGLLDEAVEVASVFIPDGPVVSVKEREHELETFEATGQAPVDVPLVVLVDRGSASASEIVAVAVKERGRGRVVGMATFGKGTVQVVRPLTAGGGVKFTTAEYFGPSGASIEGTGVQPDVPAEGNPGEQLEVARRTLLESLAAAAR